MTPSPVPSLIPIAADPSGHQVQSRVGAADPKDAVGALDGFWWERIIPAAGSGTPPFSLLKFPFSSTRAAASLSTDPPRSGPTPQQGPGGPTDEH
jgi:hypothetical protein